MEGGGENGSTSMCIRKHIEELETELRLEWQHGPEQTICTLGCFDEVSSFYGHLDLFKLWAQ